jgi:hypothetical protein
MRPKEQVHELKLCIQRNFVPNPKLNIIMVITAGRLDTPAHSNGRVGGGMPEVNLAPPPERRTPFRYHGLHFTSKVPYLR